MLLRWHAFPLRRGGAEIQKLSKRMSEIGECLVIDGGQPVFCRFHKSMVPEGKTRIVCY